MLPKVQRSLNSAELPGAPCRRLGFVADGIVFLLIRVPIDLVIRRDWTMGSLGPSLLALGDLVALFFLAGAFFLALIEGLASSSTHGPSPSL